LGNDDAAVALTLKVVQYRRSWHYLLFCLCQRRYFTDSDPQQFC